MDKYPQEIFFCIIALSRCEACPSFNAYNSRVIVSLRVLGNTFGFEGCHYNTLRN